MSKLSLSRAWDETKALLRRDGRLLGAVALALFVLPLAIIGAVMPEASNGASPTVQGNSVARSLLVALTLIAVLVGQLAITRLALGPSTTVGGAIAHGFRRLPAYLIASLILAASFLILIFTAALLISATSSAPITQEQLAKSPAVLLTVLILFVAYLVIFTRIMSVAPAVAVGEGVGPVNIIRNSWALTAGAFWRLFAFILLFMIGTGIANLAVRYAVGSTVIVLLGAIEPMSASALILSLAESLVVGSIVLIVAVMLARIYAQLSGHAASVSVPKSGT